MSKKLKKYVSYEPDTFIVLGFYNEGRKDMPDTIDEVNVDTFIEDIGQHTKYNPETKIFYTDQVDIDAKTIENERAHRYAYLNSTDKYMLIDFPIDRNQKKEMRDYRQALRDFPETGIMPVMPDFYIG